ncbi:hypothetical protein M422DRAFT_208011 [Sphaerobolus stellatus SS14]|uniref:Nascent polypeptide-associated complex subunit alpha-like UBA domain-containing protein n=1 Tax=Sphaerobolus stellatus (strain SS14) TaxID=990650 RepID=A0A0C9VZ20_SPHS4|nr:hypothetical protein M422DRAFT_208011 [Sphaerobolus stellatus SS14]
MSSYGRLEPEVIVNFADGFSYSKQRMEDAFRNSGIFDKAPTKAPKEVHHVKKEDVEVIVRELEIPRIQAERALDAAGGDLKKALETLVSPSAK